MIIKVYKESMVNLIKCILRQDSVLPFSWRILIGVTELAHLEDYNDNN